MNFFEKTAHLYKNAGHERLCLTSVPALCAAVIADNIFNSNLFYALVFVFACVLFQMSAQIFDDYFDWITSKTTKRLELEKTGIRGLYTKSAHFLADKKLPRLYFCLAILLSVIALSVFFSICIISKNYLTYLFLIPLPLLLILNYHPKFGRIMNLMGTEFLCAVSCSFLTMMCVFYASAKCIIFPLIYTGLIAFFFIYNLLYTASLLNLKPDKMTEKQTMPIILKGENRQFLFSVFLTLFPFVLLPVGVYYNILPKLSLIAELLIFHSVWFLYLIYLFIKQPQKMIKWHFLMGLDKDEIQNEQNNIGWFTVRYNFLENIYLIFFLILILVFISQSKIFMF